MIPDYLTACRVAFVSCRQRRRAEGKVHCPCRNPVPATIRLDADRVEGIVMVAEGAAPQGGHIIAKEQEAGRNVLLGGIAEQVAAGITKLTDKETRHLVLGHLQRGGQPTAFDRLLSLRFGAAAVRLVAAGDFGKIVALTDHGIRAVSLEEATNRMRRVPLDSDVLQTARDLGICLGE